jgi:hypothetical protein
MSISLELPPELESELSTEASRLNLPVSEYILRVLEVRSPEVSRSDEPPSFWERLMEFRQGLEDTDLNPDEVWGDVRDRTPMPIEPQFP